MACAASVARGRCMVSRVIFVSPEPLSPPNNGVRRHAFELARALGRMTDVDVLQPRHGEGDSVYWHRCHQSISSTSHDIVHFEGFRTGVEMLSSKPTRRLIEGRRRSGVRVVWGLNDSYSRGRLWMARLAYGRRQFWLSLRSLLAALRAVRLERRFARCVDWLDVVSDDEARYLRGLGIPNVRVLTIGRPEVPDGERAHLNRGKRVGIMSSLDGSYGAAVERFVTMCWPLIHARVSGSELWVVGSRRDGTSWRLLETAPAVVHSEWVQSLSEFYAESRVAIVPLDAPLGVPNKGLEALGYGVPVVGMRSVRSLLSQEDPAAVCMQTTVAGLVDEVERLLTDDAAAARASADARRIMDRWPTWSVIATRYLESSAS